MENDEGGEYVILRVRNGSEEDKFRIKEVSKILFPKFQQNYVLVYQPNNRVTHSVKSTVPIVTARGWIRLKSSWSLMGCPLISINRLGIRTWKTRTLLKPKYNLVLRCVRNHEILNPLTHIHSIVMFNCVT